MSYKNPNLAPQERAEDLLSQMTLEEKVAQMDMVAGVKFASKPDPRQHCSVEPDSDYDWDALQRLFGDRGVGYVHDNYSVPSLANKVQRYFIENSRLGIPCIFTGEALHGISGTRGTIFPCPINMGASFNPELTREIAKAVAAETRSLGMQEVLCPNLDLAREPRWGRLEETFGEDTYLSSRMGVAVVTGHQRDGDIGRNDAVVSEPKHYCVHGIAELGANSAPARVGRREVETSHLPVFEAAVKEGGAYNLMCSYNSIDSEVVSCSKLYLNDIAKERMGLRGVIRADWGAIGRIKSAHHLTQSDKEAIRLAIVNGLDVKGLDYPYDYFEKTVAELVREGGIKPERIDDIVRRILIIKFKLGLFENPYTDPSRYESVIRCSEHRELALTAAKQSITLIKNDGTLPLRADSIKSIAVIGPSSNAQKIGGYSSVPQFHIPSVYEILKERLGKDVTIRQCDGCAITDGPKQERIVDGQPHLYSEGEDEIIDSVEEAVSIAAECDTIIFVGGDNTITSGEGRDKTTLTLNGRQGELIEKLSQLGKPLVLVLENGKPVDLSAENKICNAIMVAWFGGESGAVAIVDALLGDYNPAGRLPVSFPRSTGRIPCYYTMLPGGAESVLEGEKNALFPFGFGLSYTSFEYGNLNITKESGDYDYIVTVDVTNTGQRDGDEVVQLYVNDVESSVVTPPLELKGFKRVSIAAGETRTVKFSLGYDSFKLMNLNYQWTVEPGEFRIMIGSSSRNIQCEGTLAMAFSI
ncbi:MAG: glycoside hydrolase family 3 C-terminal domain-containing protein [Oscillospiraceae bacterium]|nr:glycoside hydrolase family 3 C-terminal domain-containing protein [Oscillospiraceae bacterium]